MDLVDLESEEAAATGSMQDLEEDSTEGSLGKVCPSSNSSNFGHGGSNANASDKGQGHGRPLTRELLHKALTVSRPAPAGRQHAEHANVDKLLAKQTHLHLNNLQLNSLHGIGGLPKLETLYLYDNMLEDISPLSVLTTLTTLYLQNNTIQQLAGLLPLTELRKLYLEGNHISSISGLSALYALEELHISNQHLPAGQSLVLQPGCLPPALRVLSIISCGLLDDSLAALVGLCELRKLELQSNQLHALDSALEQVLRTAPRLLSLDLRNNPLCRVPRYRETVIVMSDSLSLLDGDDVAPQQRQVLMRLQIRRLKSQLAAESADNASRPAAASSNNSSTPSRSHSGQLGSHLPAAQDMAVAGQLQRAGSWRAAHTTGQSRGSSGQSARLDLHLAPSLDHQAGHGHGSAAGLPPSNAMTAPLPPVPTHGSAGKLPPVSPVSSAMGLNKRHSSASGQGLQLGMQGLQIRPPS